MKNVCGVWIEKLICELSLFFWEFYMFCAFLFLNQFFSLFTPSAPSIVKPPYWNVLASQNNTTHSTPLAPADMGSSICANDSM